MQNSWSPTGDLIKVDDGILKQFVVKQEGV